MICQPDKLFRADICCSSPISNPNYTVCFPATQVIPDSSTQANPFYDDINKVSYWTYSIQIDPGEADITDLSNWVLQICILLAERQNPADFVAEVSENGGPFIDISGSIEVLTIDPPTGVPWVLKIDRGQPKGSTFVYRITITNPDFYNLAAEPGIIAIKHGGMPGTQVEYYDAGTCGVNQLLTPSLNCNIRPSINAVCDECTNILADPQCRLNLGLDTVNGPNNTIPDCVCHDVCVQEVTMIASAEIHRSIPYPPIGLCRLGPDVNLPPLVPNQVAGLFVACASEIIGPDCASVINTVELVAVCTAIGGSVVAVPLTLNVTLSTFYGFPSCARLYPSQVMGRFKEIDGSCKIIQFKAMTNSTGNAVLIDGKIVDKLWKKENLWLTGLRPYDLGANDRNAGFISQTINSRFMSFNHSIGPCV